jgi:PEP-CTERM motif
MKKLSTALRHLARCKRSARAIGLLFGMAATAAQAGFVVTHPQPVPVDSNYPYFFTGPFDFNPEVAVSGSGVWSGARYQETRKSNLPTGPGGTLQTLNEVADSGWITRTQPGQAVGAHASIDLEPWSGSGSPTAARTTLFKNHVYANSESKSEFTNSGEVTVQGNTYAAGTLYRRGGSVGAAASAWYDAWLATEQRQAEVKLHLDGSLFEGLRCVSGCATNYPPGTDSFRPAAPGFGFSAVLAVYDMDSVIPCGFGNQYWCDRPYAFPVHITEVNFRANSNDQFPLVLDQDVTASFETKVGHRYLAIATVSIGSINGTELDFYNTVSLSVNVPAGTLFSDGLGGADLGVHFSQPVPEPGSMALCAAGLLALALRVRQRRVA